MITLNNRLYPSVPSHKPVKKRHITLDVTPGVHGLDLNVTQGAA